MSTTGMTAPFGNRAIDEQLARLVGQHAVRNIEARGYESVADLADPAGMTIEEERELAVLMQLADPGKDGDEEAAIERLVTALGAARTPAR